jgi:hypothetical protein
MRTTVRHSAASAIMPVWLFSAVILISGVHLSVAQAQDSQKKHRVAVAVTCGKELTDQCNGVPVHANNMLVMSPKGPSKTFQKMRCLGEPCCAHV